MPPTKLNPSAKRRVDAVLETAVAGRNVPALFGMVATKDRVLYAECRGERVFGKPEEGEVRFDHTLQLFSMTKLATSIAALQLAERGLVSFDDPEVIRQHLPELCRQPILEAIKDDGSEVLRARTRPLTLRHLLTHTSGLAYDFSHPLQMQWTAKHRHRGVLAPHASVQNLCTPLFFEPGADFAYSPASDWVGLLVERVSGATLGAYFDKHIFAPLGIKTEDLTFYPTENIRSRLMHMTGRTDGGTGRVVPSRGWRPIAKMEPGMIGLHSGGAGLLGTLTEYMTLLQGVLACEQPGGILSPQSFRLLFSSGMPDSDSESMAPSLGAIMQLLGDEVPAFTSGEGVAHSLGMMVTKEDSPLGRRSGTGFWSGAAQTHFWIDPKTGIVGIFATQILDMAPRAFYEVYNQFERAVYDAIEVPPAAL